MHHRNMSQIEDDTIMSRGRIPGFIAKSAGLTVYPANADDGYPWLPFNDVVRTVVSDILS
jgi:hypothetical protein